MWFFLRVVLLPGFLCSQHTPCQRFLHTPSIPASSSLPRGFLSAFLHHVRGTRPSQYWEVRMLPSPFQGTAPSKCLCSFLSVFLIWKWLTMWGCGSSLHGQCHQVPAVKSFVGSLIWSLMPIDLHPHLLAAFILYSQASIACPNSLLPLPRVSWVVVEPTALCAFSHWTP